MRQKISVVILTRNEENNIGDCLDSVKWADEIVIVDDNSTDGTTRIAGKSGAKIVFHPLNSDFAGQRNVGIDHSSGDWILQMDADERVTEDLRSRIVDISENGTDCSAFDFRRVNIFCGRPLMFGGENSHRPLRFFKKGAGRFHGTGVNETLEVKGKIGHIDAVMEHYNFPSISHYLLTQDLYSGIEAADMTGRQERLSKKMLKSELTTGPIKLFFKIYVKKHGHKDGFRGLIFAALSAWRRFLIYAKYWEMNREYYE